MQGSSCQCTTLPPQLYNFSAPGVQPLRPGVFNNCDIFMTVLEWNERLWITLLDTATVQRDGRIVFLFKSGKEIIK